MQFLGYRRDIDALRGLSVLLVVLFHAFPELLPGGYVGVDVFFVISGFLITSIIVKSLNQSRFSLIDFYSRRIRRLFPALLCVLVVAMLLGWLILFPDELKQLGYHVKYSAIYWLNYVLIDEIGYFDVESIYKPLLHLWTLSVEEQYYLVWPVLLLLVYKQTALNPLHVILAIGFVSFVANIYFIENYPGDVYYNTLTRIWQLAAGSIAGILLAERQLEARRYLFLLGCVIILFSALVIDSSHSYPGWWALIPTSGALCFIAANVSITRWGGLVQLGLISYPLYLWHWILLSFTHIYLGKTPGLYSTLSAILMSVIAAYLTYQYVERLRYASGKQIPVLLFSALIALGLAGAYIDEADGLPERAHLAYLKEENIQFQRTPMTDPECEQYVADIISGERLFDYCRAQNLHREKLVAVVGDSHAHVAYPGIAELADERNLGVILLANSSCPPFIGFLWGRSPIETADCKTKIEQILSLVRDERRIGLVFMTTRGPTYIHNDPKGDFTLQSVLANLEERRQDNLTYDSFASGMGKTLARLQQLDHVSRIVYLLENPELDFLPREMVRRPLDPWGITVRDRAMDRKLYLLRMKRYRQIVEKVGERFGKFKIIDPAPYLCEGERCFAHLGGRFLYADKDHFSVFGAQYLARQIEGQIFDD